MSRPGPSPRAPDPALYAAIWRWHFYAGLLVIPFILILSVTGALYLFKPQVERWEERAFHGLPTAGAASPDAQRDAALAAFPEARFHSYRLPERRGDAALVHLALPDNRMRDVFVSPQGKVVGALDPERRAMEIVHDIHGQLLLGPKGSWLVELAASWAIVMILSGLYLWWPRGQGRGRMLAGVAWPRLRGGRKLFWRDLHAVTGFWVAALALVLLVTGLPWAGVWGSAFSAVRAEMGWVKGPQDWTIGGEAPPVRSNSIPKHDHAASMPEMPHASHSPAVGIDRMVAKATEERLAFPVIVSPPNMAGNDDHPSSAMWTIRSDAQNRALRMTIAYDAASGREVSREGFADGHVIDRVVGYGIAWHEGQLFGWLNQLVGVLTAIGLIAVAVSGFVLWRRRKPEGRLGAPASAKAPARAGGVLAILLVLAALLPLLALSLIILASFETLVLPHMPRLARWLGMAPLEA